MTASERIASPRNGLGCGAEVGVFFPFLASPPRAWSGRDPIARNRLQGAALWSSDDAAAETIRRYFAGREPTRAYVGSETCERLVPGPKVLEAWILATEAAGRALSLVLPPLGRQAQETALTSLRLLSGVPDAEVVANDWGTVHRARTRFPQLAVVLGRLTHKMLRDPRLAEHFDSPEAPPAARSALCRSGELAPGFRELMRRYGIVRREIDPYLQPLEESEWGRGPERLSLHLPYLFVTMGRSCLPGSMHLPREDRFVAGASCQFECRRHAIEFRLPGAAGNGGGKRLIGLGNGFYHAVSPHVVDRLLAAIADRPGVDRIVLALPFAKAGSG